MSYTAAKSRSILALSAVTLAFLGGCASGPRLQVVAATAPDSKLSRALVATVMYDLDIDECFQAHATWSKSAEPQRLALSVRAADGKVFIEKAQPGKASVLGARLAGCLYGRMAGWTSSGTGRVKLDIVAHATPAPVAVAWFTPEE